MSLPKDGGALAIASRWRIEAGYLLGLGALVLAQPTRASIGAYLPLVAAGLALRCWARGHLERRAQLTQSGPYALMRHPLYVGSFLLGLGFSLMARVPALPPLFAVAFVSLYLPKALREETFLRARYGETYAAYAARVGILWPRFGAGRTAGPRAPVERFAWRRVFRHREHLAWMGAAAAVVVMCVRAAWPLTAAAIASIVPRLAN